jgi:hypothetical protein
MPTIQLPANGWRPRWYQRKAWNAWEKGIKRELLIWHRRAGKDELNLNQHAVGTHTRIGTYWHMLPEYAQARKAIWDAVNPVTGKRRIDEAFPQELRASTRDNDMFIRFKCGSTWQVVGSDNFDALVGTPPIGITLSEWALANPTAWAYLSPILSENGGWASFISTPRGANHLKRMYDDFKDDPTWFVQVLGVEQTHAVSHDAIEHQRKEYRALFGEEIADMLVEQEFNCSFAGASVGAILARAIDKLERGGAINDDVRYDPDGAQVIISSDIGFRDTAVWWFWQPYFGGYRVFDCMHGSGMDADDWIPEVEERLKSHGIDDSRLGKIHLPHDARPRTFQSKRTSLERFAANFGVGKLAIVEASKGADKVSASRLVISQTKFNKTACAEGLDGLRAWQFEWNDETRSFARDPKHDWASHFGDAFAYGAQVVRGMDAPSRPRDDERHLETGPGNRMTMADAWATQRAASSRI